METFVFLHLSDLHLSSNRTPLAQDLLRGIDKVRRLRWPAFDRNIARQVALTAYQERKRIDAILITGDLADTGTSADLNVAAEFLSGKPSTNRPWLTEDSHPTLQGCERPIVILPGNHDRFAPRMRSAGGTEFDNVFHGTFWQAGRRIRIGDAVFSKGCERLAVARADFTLRKNDHHFDGVFLGHLGQGRVYCDIIQDLVSGTKTARKHAAVIWAIHYAIKSVMHSPDLIPPNMRLLRQYRLVKAASEKDVDVCYVLCGHIHEQYAYRLGKESNIRVLGIGTAMASGHNVTNSFQYIEFDVSDRNIVDERKYVYEASPKSGQFRLLSDEPITL